MRKTNKDLIPQTVNVSISREEIGNAQGKCPIWTKFEKMFPDFKVKVLRSSIQILPQCGNRGLYGKLPLEAIAFTHDFDFGLSVEFVNFSVDLKL